MRLAILLVLVGCGTTINASNYNHDCDADSQCTRIVVGDICACSCTYAAINMSDYDKYLNDLHNIGTCMSTCIDGGDDASFACPIDIGAACSAGTCVNVVIEAGAD